MRLSPPNPVLTDEWYPVVDEHGEMHCSCGRVLVRVDDDLFVCSYGFPLYRFSDGSAVLDKFGRVMFRAKEHNGRQGDVTPEMREKIAQAIARSRGFAR